MALNVAKVTFAFEQFAYGWTESYYLQNPSSTLAPELAKGEVLAQKRIAMSGAETKITYIKVSNEDVKRDVLTSPFAYVGNLAEPSDAPDTAILTKRTTTTPVVVAPIYLRGVWDSIVTPGGKIDLTNAAWIAAYNSWKAELVATPQGWGFLARDPLSSGESQIATVTQNLNGTVSIAAEDNLFNALAVGESVKIFVSGVQGALSINGPNIAVVTLPNAVTTERRIPIFPYLVGGKISFTQPTFYKIGNTQIQRVVERKVGRPLYLSRGRRPARVLG